MAAGLAGTAGLCAGGYTKPGYAAEGALPGEDGYSLIRRIRNLSGEVSRIPAIALTAYARAEDRAKALQAGYQLHLAKPVEPDKLIKMVASLVRPSTSSRH